MLFKYELFDLNEADGIKMVMTLLTILWSYHGKTAVSVGKHWNHLVSAMWT